MEFVRPKNLFSPLIAPKSFLMRRSLLIGAIGLIFSLSAKGQASSSVLIINGGQYGNQSENVNIQLYDPATNSSRVLDTIHTQSVQDLLFHGNDVFIAAQDSIVLFSLDTERRLAANRFFGPSSYSLAIYQNQLIVGNWYGKSSHNLYFYDATSLAVVDSIAIFDKGAKSILINNGFAYVTQNAQTSNFEDTLGMIVKVDLSNRSITDTISVSNYSGEFGELIEKPDQSGFYAVNSVSNTITSVDYSNPSAANNTAMGVDLRIGSSSHWSLHSDTLYGRMHDGIGAIDLTNLSIIDSSFIDTVVTAFAYDSIANEFHITQTDFFSYNLGKTYDHQGSLLATFNVGYSPEVMGVFPAITLGIEESFSTVSALEFYPNPAREQLFLNSAKAGDVLRIFDISGRLKMEHRINNVSRQVDVSELNRGTYVISLQSAESIQTAKLIIE